MVVAGGQRIRARRFVVATGSRPAVPPIPGLAALPHLTNETVFDLDRAAARGCWSSAAARSAASWRRRSGGSAPRSRSSISARSCREDDPELTAIVRAPVAGGGCRACTSTSRVAGVEPGPVLVLDGDGGPQRLAGTHLLVAAGPQGHSRGSGPRQRRHRPRRQGHQGRPRGCAPPMPGCSPSATSPAALQFTHLAGYHAGIVIRNALFRLPARASDASDPARHLHRPRAGAGRPERDRGRTDAGLAPRDRCAGRFADNDRARAERRRQGMVKVVAGRRGRILGAAIVGAACRAS